MATYEISDPAGQKFQVTAPDNASQDDVLNYFKANSPQSTNDTNPVSDFAQSIPRGMLSGLVNAVAATGQSNAAESGMQTSDMPTTAQGMQSLEKNVTGPMYQPQGRAGQFGAAVGETLGNPTSYIGPGGLGLKVGGAILSGIGSEGGRQLAEGTPLETPASIIGGGLGGVIAGKALGPTAERAAIPTNRELDISQDKFYDAARNSGVEVDPKALANKATEWEQNLTTGPKYAFTGGPDGTAPGTLKILEKLQNPPEGATVTASNLDTLRRQINDIAGKTEAGPIPGTVKPTSDAKAAMVLKRDYASYLENPPENHIVAGNAKDFVENIKQGNLTHGALIRAKTAEGQTQSAIDKYEGTIAGRLDQQVKSKVAAPILNPKFNRGYSQPEIDAARSINRGTIPTAVLSQLGRGGAGVIPAMGHIGAAFATGGASIPASIATAVPLYAARKAAEQLTLKQAKQFRDLLAKRSPLYEERLRGLPAPPSNLSNIGALGRGILGGLR